MASTNKTTHYNLSQYIGSDKPTYLVDYNQDMSKIDTGIYEADAKAVVNATNIGDLTELTTTDKLNLVNAINEVNSESTTIGDLTDLTTTDKSSVVGSINEVNGKADTIGNIVNLTTTDKTSVVNAVNEVNAKANTIGNISNLTTTDKTSVVGAINEVNGKANNIGDLSNLITTDKTSIVNAINEIDNKEIGMTGHILWGNPNGVTSGNITLDDDILDYDIIEIYGFSSDGDCVYTKIPKVLYNKKILLSGQSTDNGGNFYMKIARLNIDSTNNVISFVYNREWYKPATSQNGGYNNSGNYIHVTDVVGYKIGLFN